MPPPSASCTAAGRPITASRPASRNPSIARRSATSAMWWRMPACSAFRPPIRARPRSGWRAWDKAASRIPIPNGWREFAPNSAAAGACCSSAGARSGSARASTRSSTRSWSRTASSATWGGRISRTCAAGSTRWRGILAEGETWRRGSRLFLEYEASGRRDDGPHRVRRRVEADQIVGLGDLDLGLELGQVVKRHDAGPTDPEGAAILLDDLRDLLGVPHFDGRSRYAAPVEQKSLGRVLGAAPVAQRNDVDRQVRPTEQAPIVDLPAQDLLELCQRYRLDRIVRVDRERDPRFGDAKFLQEVERKIRPRLSQRRKDAGQRRRYHGQVGFTFEQGKESPACRIDGEVQLMARQ